MKNSWRHDDDVEYQVASSAFTTITDFITDTHSAVRVLAITVTAEIVAFAMLYVSKDKVSEFLDEEGNKAWVYGAIGVFLAGFLTAFAAIRLVERRFPRRIPKYAFWFFSILAGLANIALFFALLTIELR